MKHLKRTFIILLIFIFFNLQVLSYAVVYDIEQIPKMSNRPFSKEYLNVELLTNKILITDLELLKINTFFYLRRISLDYKMLLRKSITRTFSSGLTLGGYVGNLIVGYYYYNNFSKLPSGDIVGTVLPRLIAKAVIITESTCELIYSSYKKHHCKIVDLDLKVLDHKVAGLKTTYDKLELERMELLHRASSFTIEQVKALQKEEELSNNYFKDSLAEYIKLRSREGNIPLSSDLATVLQIGRRCDGLFGSNMLRIMQYTSNNLSFEGPATISTTVSGFMGTILPFSVNSFSQYRTKRTKKMLGHRFNLSINQSKLDMHKSITYSDISKGMRSLNSDEKIEICRKNYYDKRDKIFYNLNSIILYEDKLTSRLWNLQQSLSAFSATTKGVRGVIQLVGNYAYPYSGSINEHLETVTTIPRLVGAGPLFIGNFVLLTKDLINHKKQEVIKERKLISIDERLTLIDDLSGNLKKCNDELKGYINSTSP